MTLGRNDIGDTDILPFVVGLYKLVNLGSAAVWHSSMCKDRGGVQFFWHRCDDCCEIQIFGDLMGLDVTPETDIASCFTRLAQIYNQSINQSIKFYFTTTLHST